ncbi:unnamed protein product [Brugia timori]|uniref:Uncharacterized protein n=1 Tax=Brugia timori TaxID=42155 RepID=A0A0R3QXA0_9BILA|nr:unnamed protein product [Brugia timori]
MICTTAAIIIPVCPHIAWSKITWSLLSYFTKTINSGST